MFNFDSKIYLIIYRFYLFIIFYIFIYLPFHFIYLFVLADDCICPYWSGDFMPLCLKGKATLKENIIKMKDILFPNILVQVS